MRTPRALVLLSAFAALAGCAAPAGAPLVIVGATLIDGTGQPPLQDAFIVIEGDRIMAVGHQSQVPLPKGARVLDARGKFVLPGPGGLWGPEAARSLAERVKGGATPVQAIGELAAGHVVEPGHPADLLILDRDPLLRAENLVAVSQVISAGRQSSP